MTAKIWMSCLERPINISGVDRSDLLKTEKAIMRVRDAWRKRRMEATTAWRSAYSRVVSTMCKLSGHYRL